MEVHSTLQGYSLCTFLNSIMGLPDRRFRSIINLVNRFSVVSLVHFPI